MPSFATDEINLSYPIDGPAAAPAIVFSNPLGTTHRMWHGVVEQPAVTAELVHVDRDG